MLAEEALFDGHPVAHVVTFYARKRERRIRAQMIEHERRIRPDRRGSALSH